MKKSPLPNEKLDALQVLIDGAYERFLNYSQALHTIQEFLEKELNETFPDGWEGDLDTWVGQGADAKTLLENLL